MHKIIIDTDNTMGMPFRWNDDGLAILYCFGEDSFDILGLTTTFGNSSVKNVFESTKRLLKSAGKEKIPIMLGAEDENDIETEAAEFLVDRVNSNRDQITILALGPLTNLYAAHKIDNKFFQKLNGIILMGGIIKKRLSIGRTKIKDANLKNDLPAALDVLNAECPVTVINCHLCKQVPLTREHLKQLEFWPDIYLNKLQNEFWVHKKVHHLDFIYMWDVLVPIYLIHPEIFNKNKIKIKTSNLDDIHDGRLSETEKSGTEINMPTHVNNKTEFYHFAFKNWKRLDRQVRKKNKEYLNFKDNKIKTFIMKALFFLMIPIFLRLMYKKEGNFYIEK